MQLPKNLQIAALIFALTLTVTGILAAPNHAPAVTVVGFEGSVTDLATGRPIRGARIETASAVAVSDAWGRYRLALPPGAYDVHASAPGYIGMTHVLRRVQPDTLTPLPFEMIPERPSPAQEIIIYQKLVAVYQKTHDLRLTIDGNWQAEDPGADVTGGQQWTADIVRVLMPDGTVVGIDMDEYLKGVVPHEMIPSWPVEALKAQAIAARTYASIPRLPGISADVDTTTRTQVWRPTHYDTTDAAVEATHGIGITYGGRLIREALFFAHCDGRTRDSEEVWGVRIPYLRSVECPNPFTTLLGHGTGLCQWGAKVFAEWGLDYQEILTHFYTGVEVTAPSVPVLTRPEITPSAGDTVTPFTFRITYSDADGDPPAAADVIIDGRAYAMAHESGAFDKGARYVYTTTLSASDHHVRFTFSDGYNPTVSTADLAGPVVTPGPPPSPTPTPPGILVEVWRQTTRLDFAAGQLDGLIIAGEEDARLVLDAGRTRGAYTSTVFTADFAFVAVGSQWQADVSSGASFQLELRASTDGMAWTPWQPILLPDAQRYAVEDDRGELALLMGPFLQYRVTLTRSDPVAEAALDGLTLTLIDSRPGPTAAEARIAASATVTPTEPVVIPRAAWGADEGYRYRDGREIWPPEYREPRVFIIHHTPPKTDLDAAAWVRAIYYYHAVTRGWGDIGYNFIIDWDGNIYEGRYGGERDGATVVGGHARRYNWGSIGVALLGDFQEDEVPSAAEDALVEFLAWRGNRYFIHPLDSTFFIDDTFPNIMGHRDVLPTACPGDHLWDRLPGIRAAVMNRMLELPPNVAFTAPRDGDAVGGVVELLPRTSAAVASVGFLADGALLGTDGEAPFVWDWHTTGEAADPQRLDVVARTALGLEATDAVTVTVDNDAPSGSVSAPELSNTTLIELSTVATGATRVQLSNDWHWEENDFSGTTGSIVDDAGAEDGRAWFGAADYDTPGIWFGPYTFDLPTWRDYRAYFRLKASPNVTTTEIALLDVVDNVSRSATARQNGVLHGGERVYAQRSLRGTSFASDTQYQEPYLDFEYGSAGNLGLEFRTAFRAVADLYLDRVWVFSAPQPYAATTSWRLPAGDGLKEISVRYLDDAGNFSPIYTTTVLLDTTPPQWLADSTWAAARVQDALSGLSPATAQVAFSQDGGLTWGDWLPATATGVEGTTEPQTVTAPDMPGATHLHFRIADRAGNLSQSPDYPLPATPTPTATPSPTGTSTPTATASPTVTPTPTATASPPGTRTPTATPMPTETWTPTVTATATATAMGSPTPTSTSTGAATATPTATETVETATPSPTPTVTCYELITNGGFETEDGWTFAEGHCAPRPSRWEVYEGEYSLLLGIPSGTSDAECESFAYQVVSVPANIVSAIVSFWYWTGTADEAGNDWQEIVVLDQDFQPLATLMRETTNHRTWLQRTFDLTPYAGQTVILYFNVHNDGVGDRRTFMYLDNVSLEICHGMLPTATPTVTSTASATATPTASTTPTETLQPTPTVTSTATATPTVTATSTPSPTRTTTATPSPTLTATPSLPPTATATETPVVCPDVVVNGGFEAEGGWTLSRAEPDDVQAHSGAMSLLLGLTDPGQDIFSFSSARQDVNIPADATSALLTFWYYPLSQDPENDRQIVAVQDLQGNQLERLLGTGPASDAGTWLQGQFDLAEHHAGRPVRLYFGVINHEGGGVTAMYVDDVSLEVCREGTGRSYRLYVPLVVRVYP